MAGKVVAFIPALNEEENIGRVLQPLAEARKVGLIHEIVVVDDGSTDGTARVAESYGAHVIRHGINRGKFEAFIAAARYCLEHGADAMLMTDADMLNLDAGKLQDFIGDFDGKPDKWMSRVGYLQQMDSGRTFRCDPEYSGFRLIRRKALEYIFQELANPASRTHRYYKAAHQVEHGGLGRGRGLELTLEQSIPKEKITSMLSLGLVSRYPNDPTHAANVNAEVTPLIDAGMRDMLADNIRLLSELRRLDPKDPRVKGKKARNLIEMGFRMGDKELELIRQRLAEIRGTRRIERQ